jgi:hypothetical protein
MNSNDATQSGGNSEPRREAVTDNLGMIYIYDDSPGDTTIRPAKYPAALTSPPRPTPPNTNPPTTNPPAEDAGS